MPLIQGTPLKKGHARDPDTLIFVTELINDTKAILSMVAESESVKDSSVKLHSALFQITVIRVPSMPLF